MNPNNQTEEIEHPKGNEHKNSNTREDITQEQDSYESSSESNSESDNESSSKDIKEPKSTKEQLLSESHSVTQSAEESRNELTSTKGVIRDASPKSGDSRDLHEMPHEHSATSKSSQHPTEECIYPSESYGGLPTRTQNTVPDVVPAASVSEEEKVPKMEILHGRGSKLSQEEEKIPAKVSPDSAHKYRQNILQFIQPYIYCEPGEAKSKKGKPVSDGIGYVRLNWLIDETGCIKGELPKCQKCSAIINSFSKVEEIPGKEAVWQCEFCGKTNQNIKTAVPKNGTTLELLEVANEEPKRMNIILCVDISPSMNLTIITKRYPNKKEEYDEKGRSYWEQVKASISKLLDQFARERPNAIVGLIFFSDKLIIHGDGSVGNPLEITKEYADPKSKRLLFNKKEILMQYVEENCKGYMKVPIHESLSQLKKIMNSTEPDLSGQTALGPCLAASNSLMQNPGLGSQIVVFTDGGANCGFGALQDLDKGQSKDVAFYKDTAEELQKKGIITSFITFGLSECSLEDLMVVTSETQGTMQRNEVPLEVPVITLPFYMEGISDIKIDVIVNSYLKVSPINDMVTINRNNQHLFHDRKCILANSIFYFEYSLISAVTETQQIPIQIQMEYHKDNIKLRRTATDCVIALSSKPPQVDFREYDVLTKYTAKCSQVALKNADKRKAIVEKLEEIRRMLLMSPAKGSKKKDCKEKVEEHLKSIKEGRRDDKHISQITSEATVEINWKG